MGAALSSDGTGLVLALVDNRTSGDTGVSVLSLEDVAGGEQLEITRTQLHRETTSQCSDSDPT
jgi:hypothetical protein